MSLPPWVDHFVFCSEGEFGGILHHQFWAPTPGENAILVYSVAVTAVSFQPHNQLRDTHTNSIHKRQDRENYIQMGIPQFYCAYYMLHITVIIIIGKKRINTKIETKPTDLNKVYDRYTLKRIERQNKSWMYLFFLCLNLSCSVGSVCMCVCVCVDVGWGWGGSYYMK